MGKMLLDFAAAGSPCRDIYKIEQTRIEKLEGY
jgi:hypothetical protein